MSKFTELSKDEAKEESKAAPTASPKKTKKDHVKIMDPVKDADANKKDISHSAPPEDVDDIEDEAEDIDNPEGGEQDETFMDVLGKW